MERSGELEGLAGMIADLIEGNLTAHPDRARLLGGKPRGVVIAASDLGVEVGLVVGGGKVAVGPAGGHPALEVRADSATLLDLTRARLLGGLPSLADPVGRAVAARLATGRLRIRGLHRIVLLSRVQRLLSVA